MRKRESSSSVSSGLSACPLHVRHLLPLPVRNGPLFVGKDKPAKGRWDGGCKLKRLGRQTSWRNSLSVYGNMRGPRSAAVVEIDTTDGACVYSWLIVIVVSVTRAGVSSSCCFSRSLSAGTRREFGGRPARMQAVWKTRSDLYLRD